MLDSILHNCHHSVLGTLTVTIFILRSCPTCDCLQTKPTSIDQPSLPYRASYETLSAYQCSHNHVTNSWICMNLNESFEPMNKIRILQHFAGHGKWWEAGHRCVKLTFRCLLEARVWSTNSCLWEVPTLRSLVEKLHPNATKFFEFGLNLLTVCEGSLLFALHKGTSCGCLKLWAIEKSAAIVLSLTTVNT